MTCGSGLKSRHRLSTGNLQGPNECKEQHVNCMAEVHDCNITPEIAEGIISFFFSFLSAWKLIFN